MTEVGVVKWVCVYEDETLEFYCCFQAGSNLWSVDRMEYRPDTVIPRYSYRYYDEGDLVAGDWYSKTNYDEDGRVINVEWRE